MPDGTEPIAVKVLTSLADVPADQWDACAGHANPFVSHAFLSALEESGSANAATGWQPQHLAIENAVGNLAACAPLYLKSHSYGEYVFDWAWADAYQRAGGHYYPKLLSAVPFSPVPGPRLLIHPQSDYELYSRTLLASMAQLAQQHRVSSVHINFIEPEALNTLGPTIEGLGFIQRTGHQFHWKNQGYHSFEDFLSTLNSRKRKAIKKERHAIAAQPVQLRTITGSDITEAHWDALFAFYLDTSARKWGEPYLNREFFSLLGEKIAGRIVLFMAEQDGKPVAAAFNLIGKDTLYGRYWGCLEDYKFLHFEACYYRAVDYAIEHGFKTVEAGAQGSHKVQRGYLPTKTHSAHWIADPGFREAVERFLTHERQMIEQEIDSYMEMSPFKTPES